MKFFTVFAVGALAAGPLVARQGSPADAIAADVQTIADNTQALSDGISSFDGSPDAVIALQQASETLINSIESATSNLPSETLEPTDAVALTTPFTALRNQVGDSIDAAIAAQQQFVDAGVAGIVYDQLTQIRAASQALSDGILAVIPESLQEIAQGLSAPILSDLDRGVQAFEQYADSPSGGASSSASETATETATETASETATVTVTAPTGPSSTGSVGTTSLLPPPSETTTIPPYDDNAAMPTAAAAYGAMGLAALAAIAAF